MAKKKYKITVRPCSEAEAKKSKNNPGVSRPCSETEAKKTGNNVKVFRLDVAPHLIISEDPTLTNTSPIFFAAELLARRLVASELIDASKPFTITVEAEKPLQPKRKSQRP